ITMKRTTQNFILLALLMAGTIWLGCSDDNNPLAPSSLAGTWKLAIYTDKAMNVTANAGVPTDIGNGAKITITGTIVLTEKRYTYSLTITTSVPGAPPQTQTINSAGTYSIRGAVITAVEDGTGETTVFTMSRSGNRLTLDNSEENSVWDKQ
ncbi:MAG: hypothetical protein ACRENG_22600, partial [bacterium]